MSCAAKYSVPDGRLAVAGPGGLRVRCTRCRAIMVIAANALRSEPAFTTGRDFHWDDTGEALGIHRRSLGMDILADDGRPAAETLGGFAAGPACGGEGSGADCAPQEMSAPAALSASGVFRPLPGVNRQVTGLFFPTFQGKPPSSRVWYAAVDNRPRGPFSASEMLSLAERGKIRDATRVWRPGFASWTKVRAGNEDLSWLRRVVLARKLKELDAQERAQARLGIAPLQLTRTSAGGNHPSVRFAAHALGGRDMPPALPEDAVDDLPPLSLHASTLQSGAWRADDLPSLRLRPPKTRRFARTPLLAMAVVVALASLSFAVVDTEALARWAFFVTLSP